MNSTVPFTMDNPLWLAETEGILSADEADLKFEFRTSDAVMGLIKSDIREVKLPLDRIEGITFRKEWLSGGSITIRVNEMRAASELPAFKEGEVVLKVARKHRETAAELVSSVQLAIAAKRKST
jgi:hypothetical protein